MIFVLRARLHSFECISCRLSSLARQISRFEAPFESLRHLIEVLLLSDCESARIAIPLDIHSSKQFDWKGSKRRRTVDLDELAVLGADLKILRSLGILETGSDIVCKYRNDNG